MIWPGWSCAHCPGPGVGSFVGGCQTALEHDFGQLTLPATLFSRLFFGAPKQSGMSQFVGVAAAQARTHGSKFLKSIVMLPVGRLWGASGERNVHFRHVCSRRLRFGCFRDWWSYAEVLACPDCTNPLA
jgi:hypothetical protein